MIVDNIEALINEMTVDEKISMLAGANLWHTIPIQRLGIPSIKVTDGPNGARGANGSSGPTSACFPVGSALAATWNIDLVQEVGNALGEETKAKGAHILLAPTVNIHRSPLAGRNFECYSEDPYLTSQMAIAMIKGIQSQGVGACIKHFVSNDSEYERRSISSEVPKRALHEIYLYPFREGIKKAKPWAVMSAYNKLNGVSCSENSFLLREILKDMWGFDGIVISDWSGTYSPSVPAGGLDLEMPGPARWMEAKYVKNALNNGLMDINELDDSVRRILRTIRRSGAFRQPELIKEQAIDRPEHRKLARKAAQEAIVLLKNDRNILPVDTTKVPSIAVIGNNAKWAQVMGGGSSEVTPHYVVSPLEGITNRVGDDVDVKFELGCPIHKNIPLLDLDWIKNPLSGGKGMYLELFDNLNVQGSPEKVLHIDRTRITWSDELLAGVSPRAFSAKFTADFIAPFSGHFTFSLRGNGMSRMYIDGQIIIDAWDEALSCVEPWDLSERLGTIELDNGKEYRIVIEYSRHGTNNYREFWIGGWPVYAEDPVEKAVALAKEVDLVILVAGLTKEWEREGADRIDMDLPGDQDQLIQKVSEVNSNVVVVLNVGSPVSMPWIDDVAAVLQSWYLGQEAGNAIADILFGDVSPSGKLPTTYPKRYEDNPAFINYPGENGKVHYGEGLHVGYRYYDKSGIEPLFPFGFGLSFTRFAYSHLGIVQNLTGSHAQISLSVNVQNIGQRFGQEVVQLYIRDMESALTRPTKELKGFKKIGLHPGEIKKVEFTLEQDALSYYDDIQDRWVVEPGVFEIQIGSSSRHIHMRDRFEWS